MCAVSGGRTHLTGGSGSREAPTARLRREGGGSGDRLVGEGLSMKIPGLWGLHAPLVLETKQSGTPCFSPTGQT